MVGGKSAIVCILCLHPSTRKWKTVKHILFPDKHYEVPTTTVYKSRILLTQVNQREQPLQYSLNF